MNPFRTRLLILTAAVALAAPAMPATAQTAPQAAAPPAIDDAGAQGIVDGIHALLADMFGTLAPPADVLHATVQGDHYRIEIPIAHRWSSGGIGGDSIGADLAPLGDGRWRIANGALPGRIEFNVDHPPQGMASRTVITLKENTVSGVIDTTLATPTQLALHVTDEDVSTEGAQTSSGSHLDTLDSTLQITPATDGVATLVSTSKMRGMHWTAAMGKQALSTDIASGAGSMRIENLSLPAMRAVVRAFSTLATLPQDKTPGAPPNPAIRTQLHTLVAALAGGATSIAIDDTMEGFSIHGAGPVQGTIGHMSFGVKLGNEDGNVALALNYTIDKPSFPAVPPGLFTEFLPSHVMLKPRLTGIDAAALRRSLDAAVDNPDPNAGMGLAMAVLDAHPATVAIDDLAIDTGPAHISAHGTFTGSGPGNAKGTATVRVVGFEAAMKDISADPQGKGAVPMLIFLKGLAKPDGDALVWDVAYDGQKLLVNGNDVSAMTPPGAAPKPAQ